MYSTYDDESTTLTIRLPRGLRDDIEAAAQREERPISNWARMKLRDAVERAEDDVAAGGAVR